MSRYAYHNEPLTQEEAESQRARELEYLLAKSEDLKREAAEADVEFWKLKRSPLETHRRVQTKLEPGEPGYSESPLCFDAAEWQGDLKWLNTSTKEPD